MADAIGMIEEGVKRKDPALSVKEVGVFKESSKSGSVGVMDIGDKAKTYVVDLDTIDALTVLDMRENADLQEIASTGQDGKRFQNKQIGLKDNETGEIDPELIALIEAAANEDISSIALVGAGSGFVEIAIAGDWSTDILRIEGSELNAILADLSDNPVVCALLPTSLDLKNKASQIAVYTFDDDNNGGFSGSDSSVASDFVRTEILSGSKLTLDEAVGLIQYGLSADGQADEDISVDFNGEAFIVELNINNKGAVDTLVLKGDDLFDAISTTTNSSGKALVDVKNKASQVAVFDYDEHGNFFVGSANAADSDAFNEIVGGSSINESEAMELVEYAQNNEDPGITYLGGDENSAIIAVEASQDTTDTLIFDFG